MNILAALPFEGKMKLNENLLHLLTALLLSTILTTSFLGQNASGQALPVGQNKVDTLFTSTFSFRPLKDPSLESYLPVISGYFNSDPKIRGNFILDTGASYSVLTDATARRLNLVTTPAIRDGKRASAGNIPLDYAYVQRFSISTSSLFDTPVDTSGYFGVLPEKALFTLLHAPLDGIIGGDHWSKIGLVLDFPNRLVTAFAPTQISGACLHHFGFDQAHPITLSLDKEVVPTVTLHMTQGKSTIDEQVIVDTGSSTTQISHQGAVKLGLKPTRKGIGTANVIGAFNTDEAAVETLQIGDLVMHNVTISYNDSENDASTLILGMDILQHYKMLLSISDRKMYLLPAQMVPAVTVAPTPPAR